MDKNNKLSMVKKATNLSKIGKIGNSKGIIIDPDTLKYLDLKIGDWVEYTLEKKNEKDNKKK